ncbi:hypothetical protein MRX96_055903 [Rhipicephalus microplus]
MEQSACFIYGAKSPVLRACRGQRLNPAYEPPSVCTPHVDYAPISPSFPAGFPLSRGATRSLIECGLVSYDDSETSIVSTSPERCRSFITARYMYMRRNLYRGSRQSLRVLAAQPLPRCSLVHVYVSSARRRRSRPDHGRENYRPCPRLRSVSFAVHRSTSMIARPSSCVQARVLL